MRLSPAPVRSRTRGARTATEPRPVMIVRSGRWPWRTSRWRPSSVCVLAWPLRKAETSASTACANRARAPSRRTSVSGSENSAGWISLTTVSWVTACHSFGGEVEARTPPRYAASTPHAVTNFRAYLAQGEAKPHAHVMLTMREVGPEGFGPKAREWNRVAELQGWREAWAQSANERLAVLGHEVRIDHRSFKEQGLALEPQNKIGPAGMRREERGEAAERAAEHRAIAQRNGERIAADPDLALNALTQQRSTFTRQDLARFVDRHTDGVEQFTRVMGKMEASTEVVRLGEDGRGRERFTTRAMLATEERMERAGERLSEARGHGVSAAAQDVALRDRGLGDEQRAALAHVTGERDLALVVGFAGTGKSTMLGAAREAWEAQGYTVRGAALSGIAAESLEGGSGIQSRT